MAFTFVHAADLHLDSPFRGLAMRASDDGEVAAALRDATFRAFDSLLELCVQRKADFLLIAGDVYDGADRSIRAQLRFRKGLAHLASHGVQCFVVHGNHDPVPEQGVPLDYPAGVHVFRADEAERVVARRGGNGHPLAEVTGISYRPNENRRLSLHCKPSAGSPLFQVALLHCNVGSDPAHAVYAPCELTELRGSGFNYWALGHVHERRVLCRDPYVVYPGNPQGLSVRECDARGCYVVTVEDDGHVHEPEFVALDCVRWLQRTFDISAYSTLDQLDSALTDCMSRAAADAEGRAAILRLTLTGEAELHKQLQQGSARQDLLQQLRDQSGLAHPAFVWVQDLIVQCRAPIDRKERAKRNDLLGQVLRIAQELDDESALRQQLLTEALDDLYGHTRAGKALPPLTDEELRELVADASELCLDLLESEESN